MYIQIFYLWKRTFNTFRCTLTACSQIAHIIHNGIFLFCKFSGWKQALFLHQNLKAFQFDFKQAFTTHVWEKEANLRDYCLSTQGSPNLAVWQQQGWSIKGADVFLRGKLFAKTINTLSSSVTKLESNKRHKIVPYSLILIPTNNPRQTKQ